MPFKDKSNIARWGHARDRRCAGNVWFMPYQTVKSRREKFDHPAGFPVELPLRCIQLHGVAAPRVLDPFLGAGTTLVAARKLGGRRYRFRNGRGLRRASGAEAHVRSSGRHLAYKLILKWHGANTMPHRLYKNFTQTSRCFPA